MKFGNLKAEMARNGITQIQIAKALSMSPDNFRGKLAGRVKFSLDEAQEIKNAFFPQKSLDYLFADDEAGNTSPSNE
ncbi:MAG: helix-turn-helix transcriptional regulator [Coriobacteriales bacterium]|jgi:hypothetical protein|nr:helix-turn-helix transcriptional regulator [Coriobacteriales bacterium]